EESLVHASLPRDLANLQRVELVQESTRQSRVETRIGGLDAEEEPVARSKVEIRRVEYRMIEPRQAVQYQHAEERGQRGPEHGHLEGRRNERRPAMQRPAAGVDRIVDHRRVPLQEIDAGSPDNASEQREQSHPVLAKTECVAQALDRERRVGVEVAVAVRASAP